MKTSLKDLTAYCLTYPDAFLDYPFGDDSWAALRHLQNKKTFAFFYFRNDKLCSNLKIEPMEGDFLKSALSYVVPAYHMNKRHWITVIVDDCPDLSELYSLIGESYESTK